MCSTCFLVVSYKPHLNTIYFHFNQDKKEAKNYMAYCFLSCYLSTGQKLAFTHFIDFKDFVTETIVTTSIKKNALR